MLQVAEIPNSICSDKGILAAPFRQDHLRNFSKQLKRLDAKYSVQFLIIINSVSFVSLW